ncbi:hypothetical protein PGQ11_005495 [Apiospora arundinis]|uniref:MARVEL domain-containing protein n=1 Tax=Apiospora arundinis TaxID=335852 RepID=A0ABR2JB11_9PEZI
MRLLVCVSPWQVSFRSQFRAVSYTNVAFQLISGAVVFGLSVDLAKGQNKGPVPPETGFSSFAGGFGLLTTLVGLAALWVDSIPGVATMIADGLAAVIYLVAGSILANAMKPVPSCTTMDDTAKFYRGSNKILNTGCGDSADVWICDPNDTTLQNEVGNSITPRCQRAVTDYSFEYLSFTLCTIMVILGYVLARRGGSRSPTVATRT